MGISSPNVVVSPSQSNQNILGLAGLGTDIARTIIQGVQTRKQRKEQEREFNQTQNLELLDRLSQEMGVVSAIRANPDLVKNILAGGAGIDYDKEDIDEINQELQGKYQESGQQVPYDQWLQQEGLNSLSRRDRKRMQAYQEVEKMYSEAEDTLMSPENKMKQELLKSWTLRGQGQGQQQQSGGTEQPPMNQEVSQEQPTGTIKGEPVYEERRTEKITQQPGYEPMFKQSGTDPLTGKTQWSPAGEGETGETLDTVLQEQGRLSEQTSPDGVKQQYVDMSSDPLLNAIKDPEKFWRESGNAEMYERLKKFDKTSLASINGKWSIPLDEYKKLFGYKPSGTLREFETETVVVGNQEIGKVEGGTFTFNEGQQGKLDESGLNDIVKTQWGADAINDPTFREQLFKLNKGDYDGTSEQWFAEQMYNKQGSLKLVNPQDVSDTDILEGTMSPTQQPGLQKHQEFVGESFDVVQQGVDRFLETGDYMTINWDEYQANRDQIDADLGYLAREIKDEESFNQMTSNHTRVINNMGGILNVTQTVLPNQIELQAYGAVAEIMKNQQQMELFLKQFKQADEQFGAQMNLEWAKLDVDKQRLTLMMADQIGQLQSGGQEDYYKVMKDSFSNIIKLTGDRSFLDAVVDDKLLRSQWEIYVNAYAAFKGIDPSEIQYQQIDRAGGDWIKGLQQNLAGVFTGTGSQVDVLTAPGLLGEGGQVVPPSELQFSEEEQSIINRYE